MVKSTTELFRREARAAWGDPTEIVRVALNELRRHPDAIVLDDSSRVKYVTKIGLLAGLMTNDTAEEFIHRFTIDVLNES